MTVNVLFDVGNALAGEGGRDDVFNSVLENINDELGCNPVDLYVMTHEHMDHVQGMLHGSKKLGIEFKARHIWMTASSEGAPYYDRFPKAKQKQLAAAAPAAKPEAKAAPKPEAKADAKPAAKPEAKTDVKPAAKQAVPSEPKGEAAKAEGASSEAGAEPPRPEVKIDQNKLEAELAALRAAAAKGELDDK